jgi:uncharacterized 2Fe-2S/4Fe-4S cluster protein (DUF4445 family)
MTDCTVTFFPYNKKVIVKKGTNLLETASYANISLNNVCGGHGICGNCKMIIKKGKVSGGKSEKLSLEEINNGYVFACLSFVESNIEVEIPDEILAREKDFHKEDNIFLKKNNKDFQNKREYDFSPIVTKIYIELDKPDLDNNFSDHQRLLNTINKIFQQKSTQIGLLLLKDLPKILRENNFKITVTTGLKKDYCEIINIEEGNTKTNNYLIIFDIGTTTIVSNLIDVNNGKTIDVKACFNSQGIYGREVTGRIISAEKVGIDKLQNTLIKDINELIKIMVKENNINFADINAVVCAGNTIMSHFLLGLPVENIRRTPYIATTVEPSPVQAKELGIEINPRGLLYSLPGISSWVGSDITAGIFATEIYKNDELSLLVDIGTNGEIVIGNKDWIVTTSASAGPALEGAGLECGIRAEKGAIEKVYIQNKKIQFGTIGDISPSGICGSGIIDLLSVLLKEEIINRSGKFIENKNYNYKIENGIKKLVLVKKEETSNNKEIYITESDIENIITAKAAIFAAMKILFERLDLKFSDIKNFYIAGAFGNYINVDNAINIGLLPKIDKDKIKFVGNTSLEGAKLASLNSNIFNEMYRLRENITYYDLMGANDYVEEFQKALFLPHTDIELFI